uniref:Aprataxin and PNK-like factor n=1 Tax=Anopheles atroparvus TaxID=41427 RepID=A0AAG5CRL5_ANOAO
MVKAVRYEGANGPHIVVTESDLIIGRDFLKIVDKRVSRQHCMIRIDNGTDEISVYIKSLHQTNHTFYRKKEATCDSVLSKDESVLLVTGDKFRLTPDGDWLVVEDTEATAQAEAREEDTQELNDQGGVDDSAIETPTSTNEVATKRGHECVDASETEGCKRSRVEEDGAVPSTSAVTPAPSALSHVADEVPPSIKIKPDPDSHISNTTSVTSAVAIKPDPDGANLASTSTTPMNIKPDPDGIGIPYATPAVPVLIPADSGTIRPSCDFGIRCYRGGKDHRLSFAHPGDLDYRRPNFPPAPPNAPLCPFGARCYRRNPSHFQDYQHPDPSAATLGRPRRRVAPPADPNEFYDYDDDDEYDLPDFDWSSSDEYNPGLYDEDDDDSVSEDEGLGCIDSG